MRVPQRGPFCLSNSYEARGNNSISIVIKGKTWADNENVNFTDINGDLDTIYNDYNGNITNANLSSAAAVAESKLAFNTSGGHSHNGADSKLIQVNRAFTWYVSGTLVVSTNNGPRYVAPQAMTIQKCWLITRTGPTGTAILVDIRKNGSTIWSTPGNRGTIASGATAGSTTTFNTTTLAAGDYLDLNIDQVGSTVAGVDLTIVLECSQP